MKAYSHLGVKKVLTSGLPKGNADTERVIRALKEGLAWYYDWDYPFDFQGALEKLNDNYNQDFLHQSLCYRALCQYYQHYVKNKE